MRSIAQGPIILRSAVAASHSQKLHPMPFASAGTFASQDPLPNSVMSAGIFHALETLAAACTASAAPGP